MLERLTRSFRGFYADELGWYLDRFGGVELEEET